MNSRTATPAIPITIVYDWCLIQTQRDSETYMSTSTIIRGTSNRDSALAKAGRMTLMIVFGALALSLSACGKQPEKPNAQIKTEAPSTTSDPLTDAAIKGDPASAKALIEAGADVNAKDNLGRTPLHMVAFYGHLKVTELLIDSGADINAKDHVGMTPLHAAVLSGGRQEVQLLLDKKADIKAKSGAGQTALHLAAATGQPKLSKFLIERGADPESTDSNGKTPLSYAVQNKHPQTTSVLEAYSHSQQQ